MQKNDVFSSVSGRIQKIFLAFTDKTDLAHIRRVLCLVRALPKRINIVLWCNSQEIGKSVAAAFMAEQQSVQLCTTADILPVAVRCVLLTPSKDMDQPNYSRWTRDPFVCWTPTSGSIRVLHTAVPNYPDEATWVEKYLKDLRFDDGTEVVWDREIVPVAGGNLLADHDFILTGVRQFNQYKEDFPTAQGSIALSALLGHQVKVRHICIGNEREPYALRHLDLFLSLTGCIEQVSGRYIVLVARCIQVDTSTGSVLDPMVDYANKYLDEVTALLKANGFCVLRNPVPVLKTGASNHFYLCALNNSIVEVGLGEQNIWLPNITEGKQNAPYYALLKQAELENRSIWESLGFAVYFVEGNYHDLMDESGALHCITNEWQREAAGSPVMVQLSQNTT